MLMMQSPQTQLLHKWRRLQGMNIHEFSFSVSVLNDSFLRAYDGNCRGEGANPAKGEQTGNEAKEERRKEKAFSAG